MALPLSVGEPGGGHTDRQRCLRILLPKTVRQSQTKAAQNTAVGGRLQARQGMGRLRRGGPVEVHGLGASN